MLFVDSYLFLFGVFILVLYCIVMYSFETLFKVPIPLLGILHILAVKVNGSDVKPGICVTVNTRSYRHTENTSLDFKPNRYYLMKINRNS